MKALFGKMRQCEGRLHWPFHGGMMRYDNLLNRPWSPMNSFFIVKEWWGGKHVNTFLLNNHLGHFLKQPVIFKKEHLK